jgi:catecholate siderophore receptor
VRTYLQVIAEQVKLREFLRRPINAVQAGKRNVLTFDFQYQIAFWLFQSQELCGCDCRSIFWPSKFDTWHQRDRTLAAILTFNSCHSLQEQHVNLCDFNHAREWIFLDGALVTSLNCIIMKMIVRISIVALFSPKSRYYAGLWAAILLIAAAINCLGQSKDRVITGIVVDQNHAAIAGARVTATGESTATSVSDRNGEFSLPVAPGQNEMRIEAEGFAPAMRPLAVVSADSERIEIVLAIASSTAVVTISETETLGYRANALETATRTLTDLRDVPQSINVINQQQIADQSMKSIADVVNYVPGIIAHQGENNRDQLVIRGVSTSADFFLNGVRDDVQYYRDLYNLDRVEVLKGPSGLTFGRGGGGGVINRVPKEAGFGKIREIGFEAGSFHVRRVTGDFNQPLTQKIAFRISSMYENSGSFRRFVNLTRYGINPTFSFTPNSETRITIGYEHFHDGRRADRGIPSFKGRPADVPIDTYFGNPDDSHVRARVDRLALTFQHQIGHLMLTNRTMLGDYDRGYQNYVPGGVNAAKTLVSLSAYNNATRRRNVFSQTDVNYSVSTGQIKHTLLLGSDLGRQSSDNFRNTGFFNDVKTSIQVAYDNPLTAAPVTFRQSVIDADNHVIASVAAAFAQDQIHVSRRVELLAGLRFDYFDLQFHNNRNAETLRRADRLLSPRMGIVVKPLTALSLYGSYSVSYLPGSGDQFSSLTSITQQLKPEQFTNYEFGAKWDARRNLTFTAAAYRQDRTNTRATDPNDPTRILQTGSQRTNGFEAGVAGNISQAWSIAGGYTHQNAFISTATAAAKAGAQVALVPRNTFSIWNKYQVINKLAVGIGIVHRADMFAAVDDSVILPAYTRIDAAVYVPLAEKWKLQANVENLANRRYYLTADGNNNISPGARRMVRVSVVTRF